MPNLRDWTASEIMVQIPGARNILAKHFGPEGISTGAGASVRDLARRKGIDVNTVVRDLDAAVKSSGWTP